MLTVFYLPPHLGYGCPGLLLIYSFIYYSLRGRKSTTKCKCKTEE
jgi:hypothetical protein